MFGRIFGRGGEPAAQALPLVRNLTIGRTLRVDPLAWRRYGGAARFALDTDVLEITAQGIIDMGADGFVHRFYTDDDLMFQVVSRDREGQKDEDHTLFMPWVSAWPPNPAARRIWLDRLKAGPSPPRACRTMPAYGSGPRMRPRTRCSSGKMSMTTAPRPPPAHLPDLHAVRPRAARRRA